MSCIEKFVDYFMSVKTAFSIMIKGWRNPVRLQDKEKSYGTSGIAVSVFHRVVERDKGLGLRFPGFLIGIEKAHRTKIGLEEFSAWWPIRPKDMDNLDEADFNKFRKDFPKNVDKNVYKNPEKILQKANKKHFENVKMRLDDHKRAFVSHIVEYELNDKKGGIPYIDEIFHYDAYERGTSGTYNAGGKALENLKKRIEEVLDKAERDGEPYTHIMLYAMGWNTDQQESLRNYNSLVGLMIEKAEERNFKPLFIGISWASKWGELFNKLAFIFSYVNKNQDADEIAMIWVSRLLRCCLIDVKKEYGIPLILIGHSFGARIVTRAVFGYPSKLTENHSSDDIDLVIGLQGAFTINRFIFNQGGEGSPYSNYYDYARKFVLTWSKYDSANPMAVFISGAKHAGSTLGYNHSLKKVIFSQFTIKVDSQDDNYFYPFHSIEENRAWKADIKKPETVAMVDATELVRFKLYTKGGNAHSDIYTPGMAEFIWNCIDP